MSGRKQSHLNDGDMVAADDAEPAFTATLTSAIAAPTTTSSSSYDNSTCGACTQACQPAAKQKKRASLDGQIVTVSSLVS